MAAIFPTELEIAYTITSTDNRVAVNNSFAEIHNVMMSDAKPADSQPQIC